jgi:hypothetical protein
MWLVGLASRPGWRDQAWVGGGLGAVVERDVDRVEDGGRDAWAGEAGCWHGDSHEAAEAGGSCCAQDGGAAPPRFGVWALPGGLAGAEYTAGQ